jgi:uncharacterized membrane protein
MSRFGRSLWAAIAFVVVFVIIISVVAEYFLFPAMQLAHDASPAQKRQLMAASRLMMMIVLFVLCVVMFMLFRVRRFFFPQSLPKRERTQYIDVWAEAGRRAQAPPAEPQDEDRQDPQES